MHTSKILLLLKQFLSWGGVNYFVHVCHRNLVNFSLHQFYLNAFKTNYYKLKQVVCIFIGKHKFIIKKVKKISFDPTSFNTLIVPQTTETRSRNCFLWCNTTSLMVSEDSRQGIFVVGYTLPPFFYVAGIMLSHRRSLYWKQPFIYTVFPHSHWRVSSNLSSRFSTF